MPISDPAPQGLLPRVKGKAALTVALRLFLLLLGLALPGLWRGPAQAEEKAPAPVAASPSAAAPAKAGDQKSQAAPQTAPQATSQAAPAPAAPAAAAPATTPSAEGEAAAQKPAPLPPDPQLVTGRDKLEAARTALTSIEGVLAVEGLRASDLDELRSRLDPLRRDLASLTGDLNQRLSNLKGRLATLPPKPADGASEDAAVTADRERLQKLSTDFEALLTPARALSDRLDQINNQISTRRRALFTGRLFERGESVFDPTLWSDAVAASLGEVRGTQLLISDWAAYAAHRQEQLALFGILAGVLAIIGGLVAAGRFLRARLRRAPADRATPFGRTHAALEALKVLVLEAAVAPLALAGGLAFAHLFDVVPPRVDELMGGLVAAVALKTSGTAMARAALAPGESWRRLPPISDHDASVAFQYFSWACWVLAVAVFLDALHRTLFAPLAVTVVTSAAMALLIVGFLARFLVHLSTEEPEPQEAGEREQGGARAPTWTRFLVWLVVAGVVAALAVGYVSFASFVAARLVLAGIILGILYVLNALIDALIDDGLSRETQKTRGLARLLGLTPRSLELMGVIFAGLLKVLLVLLALALLVGSWGATSADVLDLTRRLSLGLKIGNVSITPWSVLYAVVLLLVGIALARGLQGWVSSAILPRTGLEPSLQSSISTIIGYVGVIAALMLSMGELGLNLENIALVAGALSVGIGFGLQSIVSNFVSGIILLAERPIRVGDTINVKGEEGYVRRISVRSTQIETFDRAAVIIPNSDLITGMVKNFTHANTTGRIILAVNVSYDADPELVRDILVACAYEQPQVLQTPPPRVFLLKFSEMGLGFELRCVVANVDYALTVRSDLHFRVLARFREAGIGIAAQPWASLARAPADMVPRPVAPLAREAGDGDTPPVAAADAGPVKEDVAGKEEEKGAAMRPSPAPAAATPPARGPVNPPSTWEATD